MELLTKEGYDLTDFNIPVQILKEPEGFWIKCGVFEKTTTQNLGTSILVNRCRYEISRMKHLEKLNNLRI